MYLRRLFTGSVFLAMPAITSAHEFWIDPIAWQIAPGQVIEANIKVGEKMKGSPQIYAPKRTRRFDVASSEGVFRAGGTVGDRPAIQFTPRGRGLHTVIYVTGDNTLTYSDMEKFGNFVRHKDLGDTLAGHAARGLPIENFKERYSRYAKSLVTVGGVQGADQEFGLLTELTALENPYLPGAMDGVSVRLTYEGAPRANEQIEVFERNSAGDVAIHLVRTDRDGVAVIAVKPGFDYMLDAVVMRPLEPAADGDPVWESLWANLTFHVPPAVADQ